MWTIISSIAAAMLLISAIAAEDLPAQNQNEGPQDQQPQQSQLGLQFPGPSPFSFQAQSAEQMIESSHQAGGIASGLGDSVMDTSAPSLDEGFLRQFLQIHKPGLAQERQVENLRQQQISFNMPQGPPGPQEGSSSQNEPLMSWGPERSPMEYQQFHQPQQHNSEVEAPGRQEPQPGNYPGPSELRREQVQTWQDFRPQGQQLHEAHSSHQNVNQEDRANNNNFHPIQYLPGQLSNYAFLPPPPNFKVPSNPDESEDDLKPVSPPPPPVRQSKKISNGRKKKAKTSSKPVEQSGKTRPRGDVRLGEREEDYDYIESPSDIEVYRVPVGDPRNNDGGRQTKQRRKKPKKSSTAAGTNSNVLYYEDPRDIANINVLKDLNEEQVPRRRKPSREDFRRPLKPTSRPTTPIPQYIYDYVEEEEEDLTSEQQQQPTQKLRTKVPKSPNQRVKSQAEMDSEFLLGKFLPELLAFQRNSAYASAFYQNMFAGMAPQVMGGMQGPPMFPMMLPAPSPTVPTTTTTSTAEAPTATSLLPAAEKPVSETPLTESGNAAIVGSISYDFTVPRTEESVAPPPPPTREVPSKSDYYKSALFLPSQVAALFDEQQRPIAPPTTVAPLPFVPTQVSYLISPQHQRQHFEIQPSSGYHYREQLYSVDPVVSPIHPTAPPKKAAVHHHHGTMSPLRHQLAQLSKYFYPKHLLQHRPSVYGTAAPPPSQAPHPPLQHVQSIRSQPVYLQQSLQHPEGFNINMRNPPPVLFSAPPAGSGPLLPIRVPPHQYVQSTPPKLPGLPAHLVPLTSAQAHGMLNNPLLLPQDPMHRLQLQEALQLVSRFTAVQSARLNGFPSPNVAGPLVPASAPHSLSYLPAAGRQQSPQYMGQMAYGSEVKPVVVPPPPVQQQKLDSDSAVGDSNQVNVIAVPKAEGVTTTTESNASLSTEATTVTTVGTTTKKEASTVATTTAPLS